MGQTEDTLLDDLKNMKSVPPYLEDIWETVFEPLLVVDSQGIVLYASRSAARFFECSLNDLLENFSPIPEEGHFEVEARGIKKSGVVQQRQVAWGNFPAKALLVKPLGDDQESQRLAHELSLAKQKAREADERFRRYYLQAPPELERLIEAEDRATQAQARAERAESEASTATQAAEQAQAQAIQFKSEMDKAVMEAQQANERFRRLYERSGPAVEQLEGLESQLGEARNEASDLSQRLNHATRELGDRDQTIASLQAAVDEWESRAGSLVSPDLLEEAKQKINHLQSQLVSQMEQIQTVQQNEAAAWEQIGQLRAELHQAREQLEVLARQKDEGFSRERSALEHRTQEAARELAAAKQAGAELQQQLASLQNQMALLPAQEDLDRSLAEIAQLKLALQDAQHGSSAAVAETEHRFEDAQRQLAEARHRLQAYEAEAHAKVASLRSEAQARIQALEAELKDREADNQELRQQLDQNSLMGPPPDPGASSEEVETLKAEIARLQGELSGGGSQSLFSEMPSFFAEDDSQVQQLNQQLADAQRANQLLAQELDTARDQLEFSVPVSELEHFEKEITRLREELERPAGAEAGSEELEQLRRENQDLKEKLEAQPVAPAGPDPQQQAQLEQLEQENSDLKNQLEAQAQQPVAFAPDPEQEAQLAQLEQENADLRAQLETQAQQQVAFAPDPEQEAQLAQVEQENAELRAQLESQSSQLESQSTQLQTQAAQLESQAAQLEGQAAQLETQAVQPATEPSQEHQEELARLRAELEELHQRLEAQSETPALPTTEQFEELERLRVENAELKSKPSGGISADYLQEMNRLRQDNERLNGQVGHLEEELRVRDSGPDLSSDLQRLQLENTRLQDELIALNAQFGSGETETAPEDGESSARLANSERELRDALDQVNQFRNQALTAESEILNLDRQRQELEEQLAQTSESYEAELRTAQQELADLKTKMEESGEFDEKLRTVERRAALFEEKMLEFEDRARQAEQALRGAEEELEQLRQQPAQPAATAEPDRETARLAFEDNLTRLPNINILNRYLDMTSKQVATNEGSLAVLVIDLDKFRVANDTLGHKLGDELLRQVGQRLDAVVDRPDVLGRRGEDEFIVVVFVATPDNAAAAPSGHTPAANRARGLAGKIMNSLRQPFTIENQSIHLTASLGISLFPGDANTAQELIEHADSAMYNAKDNGRARTQFYTQEIHRYQEEKLRMTSELHQAIARNEFRLVYQPIVNLGRGRIEGLEALLRWQHPTRGLLEPQDFLEVAEDSALIISIGDWVVEEACKLIGQFRNKAFVSINVSPRQLMQASFTRRFMKSIERARIRPDRVVVEINEATGCLDNAKVREVLAELAGWSVGIGLDDFGTGSSSVRQLKETNVKFLKIDQSWTRGVPNDPQCSSIVKGAIGLASGLGTSSLAEGIEEASQLKALKSYGCLLGQGFYFSPPVDMHAVTALMKKTFKV